MRLTEKLFDRLFGRQIEALADTKLKETLSSIIQETGIDIEREHEDALYRRLGESRRDLPAAQQEKMIVLSEEYYLRNPLAKRHIELFKDYVLGEGITWDAEDKLVKDTLQKHWDDPVNAWELKQHNRVRELSLYGEQFYKVFVNKENGHVKLCSIDPGSVDDIIRNEENAEILEYVVLKQMAEGVQTEEERKLRIIHKQEEQPQDDDFGQLVGEVFFFSVNRSTHQKRGHSDMLPNLDWLDGYDRFLFTSLERAELMRAIFWHIIIKGGKTADLIKRREKMKKAPPKSGTFLVTDENFSLNAISPDLKSGQLADDVKTFKAQIITGTGFPEHFFGMGGDVNRATALEMGSPVMRMIKNRQNYIRAMISQIFNFQIDAAIRAKKLKPTVNRNFTIEFPEPSPKEARVMSETLRIVTETLALAQEAGWISKDSAQKVYLDLLSTVGVEIEPEEDEKKKEDEAKGEGTKDYEDFKIGSDNEVADAAGD